MYEEIKTRVRYCLNSVFVQESNQLYNKESFDKIELDSLLYIKFIVLLEEEFKIEFPDEYLIMDNISDINTIAEIISSISEN